ncbi:MAG: hypothetical protein LVS60_14150 [Nodosilinea sp. LVE1205-7]
MESEHFHEIPYFGSFLAANQTWDNLFQATSKPDLRLDLISTVVVPGRS